MTAHIGHSAAERPSELVRRAPVNLGCVWRVMAEVSLLTV